MVEIRYMRDVDVLEGRALVCLDNFELLRSPSCIRWILNDGAKGSEAILSQGYHRNIQIWRNDMRQHFHSETGAKCL